VLGGWALATVTLTMVLTVACGLLVGLQLHAPAGTMAAQALTAGVLSAALAAPLALVSSWRRGYLPGFVALVAVVVATQVITALGGGAWFPYAAPSLWMGMGGPDAAREVTAVQLVIPIVVAVLAALGTTSWWRHAEAS
jgi:ABC-2 type transport system permease protein